MPYAVIDDEPSKINNIKDEIRIHVSKSWIFFDERKIIRKLKKYHIRKVILSNELSHNVKLNEILKKHHQYIVTGKRIGKILIPKILLHIAELSKYPVQKFKVAMLMDEYSIENIDLIECIARETKSVTIFSCNYRKYQRIVNKLFEQYGITIKVLDKGLFQELKRNNFVINIDFSSEEIQDIAFCRNSIILSLNTKINKMSGLFDGIIITDLDILGKEDVLEGFQKLAFCEVKLYNPLRKIKENERIFENEGYHIAGYLGVHGNISKEEFIKNAEKFT